MRLVSWRPWSNIPLSFQTRKQKLHTIVVYIATARCIFYIWCIWLYAYFTANTTIPIKEWAVAVLIDTSISMSATDVLPNRYRHAISIATGLMQAYDANYITIPFGWLPLVRTPWSQDTQGIEKVLSQFNLWWHHVNQVYMWSAPWNAIWLAWDYLKKYPTEQKTIVLLWDGNTNTWYTIDAFLPYLVQDKIQLIICAMWDTENVLGLNHADSPIINAIDLDRMTYITQQTNGKRWICNDQKEAVENITTQLRAWTVVKTDIIISDSIRTIWTKPLLHFLSIISILYLLITSLRGFIWYIFYSET